MHRPRTLLRERIEDALSSPTCGLRLANNLGRVCPTLRAQMLHALLDSRRFVRMVHGEGSIYLRDAIETPMAIPASKPNPATIAIDSIGRFETVSLATWYPWSACSLTRLIPSSII